MFQVLLILGCICLAAEAAENSQKNCFRVEEHSCHNISYYFNNFYHNYTDGRLEHKWNSLNPLKVLIHSFGGNRDTSPNEELRPIFLRNPDLDVLSMDYSVLVRQPCYQESVHNAKLVGRCLGEYLAALAVDKCGDVTVSVHLIGTGIGAHIAGFAGQHFYDLRQQKLQRITGLDPAKPLFLTKDLSSRLDAGDAHFVDVIHTDVMFHGLLQPIGHVDFFPNMGLVQPNCGSKKDFDAYSCYHKRATDYFAESIESTVGFWAFKCRDMYDYIKDNCEPDVLRELGYRAHPLARGSYFLGTNEMPPYARGKDFSGLDRTLHGKTFLDNSTIDKLREMGSAVRNLTTYI